MVTTIRDQEDFLRDIVDALRCYAKRSHIGAQPCLVFSDQHGEAIMQGTDIGDLSSFVGNLRGVTDNFGVIDVELMHSLTGLRASIG